MADRSDAKRKPSVYFFARLDPRVAHPKWELRFPGGLFLFSQLPSCFGKTQPEIVTGSKQAAGDPGPKQTAYVSWALDPKWMRV